MVTRYTGLPFGLVWKYVFIIIVWYLGRGIARPNDINEQLESCGKNMDTHGRWYRTQHIESLISAGYFPRSYIANHFIDGNIGEAMEFDDIWIPDQCAYLRFTRNTLDKCVKHELSRKRALNHSFNSTHLSSNTADDAKLHIAILGDSAIRGILCGVGRILAGSEMYGPSINAICGGGSFGRPVGDADLGKEKVAEFLNGTLAVSFMYIHSLKSNSVSWQLDRLANIVRPHAVVVSSGEWEFKNKSMQNLTFSRSRRHRDAILDYNLNIDNQTVGVGTAVSSGEFVGRQNLRNTNFLVDSSSRHESIYSHQESVVNSEQNFELCDNQLHRHIAKSRANAWVNSTFNRIGELGVNNGVNMIYRNNHYNSRFPARCADQQLESEILNGGQWSVWDNSRISKDIWQSQSYNGFNFDRHRVDTVEMHVASIELHELQGKSKQGVLEIQLAQSFLNYVFHDCIVDLFSDP